MDTSSLPSPPSAAILPWLAKTRHGEHSILWHSIDAGAVARHLVSRKGYLRDLPDPAREAICLLIALHDIGKISECFRRQITPGETRMVGHLRHDILSLVHLAAAREHLCARLDVAEPEVIDLLCAAVAGHHGRPVHVGALGGAARDRLVGARAWDTGRMLIDELCAEFPGASLASLERQTARSISFALAGLATHADWIASDQVAFPPRGISGSLQDYRDEASASALRALEAAGFRPTPCRPYEGVSAFTGGACLRPLQAEIDRIAGLSPLPDLVIIEDQAGAGKTESALALAHAFIAAGRASGIYFALPTMATANALHGRAQRAASSILHDPETGLAHAQASRWLTQRTGEDDAGDDPSSRGMTAWMGSETRRSLLADIGVGTIDQAMMSVLRTKFHALRHHALRDKVLVIDEAHEADPYMEAIILRLLEFRGRQSLPTILMSATLPMGLRDLYADAYRRGQLSAAPKPTAARPRIGARPQPQARLSLSDAAYPAITTLSNTPTDFLVRQMAVAPAMPRRVRIQLIDGPSACLELIARTREAGASVVWIRNSVDEAIAAWEELRGHGIPARILHSRFTPSDRRSIERGLLADFGPDRPDPVPGRPGEVVIATQVIEAGLDVDFDVMISDLAPMSSLLQRHGRNRRHLHRARVAGLPEIPTLYVNAPDPRSLPPEPRPDWLEAHLGRGRHVYRDDIMWQTLSVLNGNPVISLPEDTRRIVEESFSSEGLPSWVRELAAKFDEEANAGRFMSAQILIDPPSAGYSEQSYGDLLPEASVTTRLGRPQVSLALLLLETGGELPPERAEIEECLLRIDARRLPVSPARMEEIQKEVGERLDVDVPEGVLPVVLMAGSEPGSWEGEACGKWLSYRADRGLVLSACKDPM